MNHRAFHSMIFTVIIAIRIPPLSKLKVVAYGSKDAVVIAASFQENNYAGAPDNFRNLAYYAILAAQLKYDIIGEIIAPELFFKFYLNDYAKNEAGIKNAIDELVEELKLSDRLKSSL